MGGNFISNSNTSIWNLSSSLNIKSNWQLPRDKNPLKSPLFQELQQLDYKHSLVTFITQFLSKLQKNVIYNFFIRMKWLFLFQSYKVFFPHVPADNVETCSAQIYHRWHSFSTPTHSCQPAGTIPFIPLSPEPTGSQS